MCLDEDVLLSVIKTLYQLGVIMTGQLLDFTGHPNGRRYSAEDREAAYLCWKLAAGRSLRKCAEVTGVSASTLGTWQQEDGWVARSEREDTDGAESMRRSIQSRVIQHADTVVEMMVEIMNDKTKQARDRMEAGKWLAGLAGVAPIIKAETAFIDRPAARPESQADISMLTDDEIAAREAKTHAA